MGANHRNPKAVQIQAINDAIKEMGMLTRIGVSEVVEQLLDALVDDELPERILMVDYRGHNESWLLATNQRLILMYPKLFSKKRNVQSFPYDQLTDVEWDPGKAKHRITIHTGRKKEVCHGWWIDGQGKGRDMVEHVRAKIPQGAALVPSTLKIPKPVPLRTSYTRWMKFPRPEYATRTSSNLRTPWKQTKCQRGWPTSPMILVPHIAIGFGWKPWQTCSPGC